MQAPFGFEEGKQAVDEAQGASSIRSSFVPHSRSKSLPLSKSLPAMLREAMQAGPSLIVSKSHSLAAQPPSALRRQLDLLQKLRTAGLF